MKFSVIRKYITQISQEEEFKDLEQVKEMFRKSSIGYRSDPDDIIEVDEKLLTIKIADRLSEISKMLKGEGSLTMRRQLTSWKMIADGIESAVIKDLKLVPSFVEKFMSEKTEFGYIFKRDSQGLMNPQILYSASYRKPFESYGVYHPAEVTVNCKAVINSDIKSASIEIHKGDLKGGITIPELFERWGWYIESSALLEEYDRQMNLHREISTQVGTQYLGVGKGIQLEGGWRREGNSVSLIQDGVKTKLVVDTDKTKAVKVETVPTFYRDPKVDDDGMRPIPVHPLVTVYDLINHQKLSVHVDFLEKYQYKPELKKKLILPEEHLNLIDVLSTASADMMEDIVEGKTGGIIVLATGKPGTGKTLTAEIYSEVVQKPLYIVQSSQLGITPTELEEELKKVLRRAQKWDSILLIDEADVFIHERGSDIQQNAIVGVFLRVLEYYKGILFMTSNRLEIIDDAIRSRATAEIVYELPSSSARRVIWRNLITQFELGSKIPDFEEFLDGVTEEFQTVSGRDIKSLLKLGGLLAKNRDEDLTVDLMKFVAGFKTLSK